MKLTLLLMLLAGPAFAGGGSFFGPGGGESSSSTGTHTDGGNASFKSVVAETLTSTGTAPSLTATGASVNGQLKVSSAPIITDGSAGEVIIDRSQASDAAGSGHAIKIIGNGGGAYTTLGLFKGASAMGYFGYGNSGSILTGAGAASLSLRAENDLHLGAGGNNLTATLTGGKVGIGTASPLAKLSVVGDSSFSQPATFLSSVTVNGADAYLGIGDDTQYATANQRGHKVTAYNDGSLYLDYKTVAAGAVYFRTGAGAESGSARTWMTLFPTTAKMAPGGPFALYSRTIAQLLAITPAIGDKYLCSNCSVPGSVAIGTAPVQGAFGIFAPGAFQ